MCIFNIYVYIFIEVGLFWCLLEANICPPFFISYLKFSILGERKDRALGPHHYQILSFP